MHKYATALWILVLLTAVGCETISANGDGAAKQWWQDDGDVKTTSLEPVLGRRAGLAHGLPRVAGGHADLPGHAAGGDPGDVLTAAARTTCFTWL